MNTWHFDLHWKDGKVQRVSGDGKDRLDALANACNAAGIGNGALRALDYWEVVCPNKPLPIT